MNSPRTLGRRLRRNSPLRWVEFCWHDGLALFGQPLHHVDVFSSNSCSFVGCWPANITLRIRWRQRACGSIATLRCFRMVARWDAGDIFGFRSLAAPWCCHGLRLRPCWVHICIRPVDDDFSVIVVNSNLPWELAEVHMFRLHLPFFPLVEKRGTNANSKRTQHNFFRTICHGFWRCIEQDFYYCVCRFPPYLSLPFTENAANIRYKSKHGRGTEEEKSSHFVELLEARLHLTEPPPHGCNIYGRWGVEPVSRRHPVKWRFGFFGARGGCWVAWAIFLVR